MQKNYKKVKHTGEKIQSNFENRDKIIRILFKTATEMIGMNLN